MDGLTNRIVTKFRGSCFDESIAAMHDETPFRIVLIAVSVIQTAISVRYLRKARADVTLLRNRQAGITLTAFIVVSYIAYVIAVVAYLIQPSWTEWAHLALPAWARWLAVGPLLLGAALIIRGLHDLGANLTISPSTNQDHERVQSRFARRFLVNDE